MSALLHNYLIVGAMLFTLGAIGFLTRRNLIVMFLSAELMLQGVALNLVAFGGYHRSYQGQSFVIFMLTVAACEAAIALALILMLYRLRRTLDISTCQELREPDLDRIEEEEPLDTGSDAPTPTYPTLTVAGREPETSITTGEGSYRA